MLIEAIKAYLIFANYLKFDKRVYANDVRLKIILVIILPSFLRLINWAQFVIFLIFWVCEAWAEACPLRPLRSITYTEVSLHFLRPRCRHLWVFCYCYKIWLLFRENLFLRNGIRWWRLWNKTGTKRSLTSLENWSWHPIQNTINQHAPDLHWSTIRPD